MKVCHILTEDGKEYYSADKSPNLMREIMSRCNWRQVTIIDLPESAYNEIPATHEAADLFIR